MHFQYPGVHNERLMDADSMDQLNEKIGDQKVVALLFLTCFTAMYNMFVEVIIFCLHCL